MYKYRNHFMWSNDIINSDSVESRKPVEINGENLKKLKEHYKEESTILSERELELLAQIELISLYKTVEYYHQDSLNSMLLYKLMNDGVERGEAMRQARKEYPLSHFTMTLSEEDSEFLESLSSKLPKPYNNWVKGIDVVRHDGLLETIMMVREKTKRKILFEVL